MKTWTKALIGVAALAVTAAGVAHARGPMGACGNPDTMGYGPAWGDHAGGPGMKGGMAGPHGWGHAQMVDRMFDKLDTDKDGAVTLAEAMAFVDARFDKIDTNHDGVIDRAEIDSWVGRRAPKAAEHFLAQHDLDGDGKVTKAEFEKPAKKLFALFDRNDDGKVTKDELEKAHAAMPHGPMGPGHGGMMPGGMPWMSPGDAPAAPPAPPAK
ncbi:hypothetical protein EYW49_02045 [Siculibacillus lacustris]|uniref:EF-hand domain-containing protein n=1 Tax=Siculibacillus lacustris TaxID=1549641 RepID=A0A4Q9VX57_9HYPH|nr:EF-hand domain-containing protein [Siculibacillus lacustris]TBW40960.1 hypothetical protein EYW49_02045 [Siculibacillus lacustris]